MTTYYVATAGSDAVDGMTTVTPWRTLAKAQGVMVPGDTVLLRRGDRWKETLTLPADNITVGAYGVAPVLDSDGYGTNAPIIDGGEFVTGWTPYAGGVSDSFSEDNFAGTTGANLTTSVPEIGAGAWVNTTSFTPSSMVLTAAGGVRKNNVGSAQYTLTNLLPPDSYYVQCPFHVYDLSVLLGTQRLIARASTSAGVQTFYYLNVDPTNGGQFTIGDFINGTGTNRVGPFAYPFTIGHNYIARMEIVGTKPCTITGYVKDTTAGDTNWTLIGSYVDNSVYTANSPSGTPGYAGLRMGGGSSAAPTDTQAIQFQTKFEVGPLGAPFTPANTYRATLATDPQQLVDLRGEYSFPGSGVNQLEDGESLWLGGTLYVRRNAGQPSNTDVIVGTRDNAIVGGAHIGATIQDIAIEHTRDHAITFTGGSGCTLRRVYTQRSGGASGNNGVWAFAAHSGLTVDASIMRDCGTDGLYMSACPDHTVTDCRLGPVYGLFADLCQHDVGDGVTANGVFRGNRFTMVGSPSPKGCLILFGDEYLVDDNYFEGGNNFGVSCPGSHFEVANNVFYAIGLGGGFRIADNVTTAFDDHLVHHNVFIECPAPIIVQSQGAANRTNQRYYANTFLNDATPVDAWVLDAQGSVKMAGEFKDNIVWNPSGAGGLLHVPAFVTASSFDSDYNVLGPDAAGMISWLGATYATLAAHKAGASQDAHSISADPLFVNPGGHAEDGSDYMLQAGSPALGAGTLVPGVVTVPDIGAFGVEVIVVPPPDEPPPDGLPMRPTVAEVSILERTRTVGEHSGGLGGDTSASDVTVFDANTRPTATEVERVIDQAYDLVIGRLPSTIPEAYSGAVRSLVALQAAILIETSFFRESLDEGSVEAYTAMLTAGLPRLTELIDEEVTETTIGGFASLPVRSATVAAAYPVEIL